MKKNMGTLDRILRAVAALVLIVLNLTGVLSGTLGVITLILAIVFLLTALVSFCPLYVPFKLSTLRK